MHVMSQDNGATGIQPILEILNGDLDVVQVCVILGVDICIDDMVSPLGGRLHDDIVIGEEGGAEIGGVSADYIDERVLQLCELRHYPGLIERGEIRVAPGMVSEEMTFVDDPAHDVLVCWLVNAPEVLAVDEKCALHIVVPKDVEYRGSMDVRSVVECQSNGSGYGAACDGYANRYG